MGEFAGILPNIRVWMPTDDNRPKLLRSGSFLWQSKLLADQANILDGHK